MTIPIPDGDTEKLDKARSAWSDLHDAVVRELQGKVGDLIDKFDELYGEEIDVICDDLNELDSLIDDYITTAADLHGAAEQHKGYLDEVRKMLVDVLNDLATELAITAAISVVASFVTFGAGAAAGAAKAVSTIARFARRIESAVTTATSFGRFRKFIGMLGRMKQRCANARSIEILRLEVKQAKPGIRRNSKLGQLGELRAGLNPKSPKEAIDINGRMRIPDKIDHTAREVVEVKNVNKLSKRDVEQIKDSVDYAQQQGYSMRLFIDDRTATLPAEIQKLVDSGALKLSRMNLN